MSWTITESYRASRMKQAAWDTLITVILTCTSDASGCDQDLSADAMSMIKGSWFYALRLVPGTGDDEPSAAYDCDIEDENNLHILDTDSNATAPTGGASNHAGSDTMGVFPPIEAHNDSQVSFVCGTLGNGNKVTAYLYFTK